MTSIFHRQANSLPFFFLAHALYTTHHSTYLLHFGGTFGAKFYHCWHSFTSLCFLWFCAPTMALLVCLLYFLPLILIIDFVSPCVTTSLVNDLKRSLCYNVYVYRSEVQMDEVRLFVLG